ncbi:MAG: hypothetical protein AB1Z63_09515, partial [Candidatus Limnocylindrales bacterium]
DHKGDETVVLADAVWTWDEATEKGVAVFAQEVAAGDRGRGRRRRNGNGRGAGSASGRASNGRGAAPADVATPPETLVVPRVSPLRGGVAEGTISITIGAGPPPGAAPAARPVPLGESETVSPVDIPPQEPMEPVSGPAAPPAFESLSPDAEAEPPLPAEAGAAVASAERAQTVPTVAGPGQVLHVRFAPASDERLVAAFEGLKGVIKARPGETPVVLHIPAGQGRTQEMRLGAGIAYDAELVAECGRRFDGMVQLTLG